VKISNIQYISIVFVFSMGKPFRKPFYENFWFLINLIVALTVGFYLILGS